jgi:putative transposase
VEVQRAALLPTPSFHTVFPVPHTLNTLIVGNKRPLLTLLFRTASQTLLPFGRHNLDGQLGATMVLHTWDPMLNAHCHLHCLVPAGALAEDGTRWVPTPPRVLFPVQALSTVCRATVLAAVQQADNKEALSFAQGLPGTGPSHASPTCSISSMARRGWCTPSRRVPGQSKCSSTWAAISTASRLRIIASVIFAMAMCASRIAIGAKAIRCKP